MVERAHEEDAAFGGSLFGATHKRNAIRRFAAVNFCLHLVANELARYVKDEFLGQCGLLQHVKYGGLVHFVERLLNV